MIGLFVVPTGRDPSRRCCLSAPGRGKLEYAYGENRGKVRTAYRKRARWRQPQVSRPRRARRHAAARDARVLRIIGGTWRGRKLRFPGGGRASARPRTGCARRCSTGWARASRARAASICSPAAARSGLEALSRGAAHVTFVERDAGGRRARCARALAEWGARRAQVERADALRFLAARARGALRRGVPRPAVCGGTAGARGSAARRSGWLRRGRPDLCRMCGPRPALPPLPASWQPLKAKQAGEVGYHLFAHAARGVTRAV